MSGAASVSPEFVNRIDAVITYRPLDAGSLELILDQQIAELGRHIEIGWRSGRLIWRSTRRAAVFVDEGDE